jgi:hypothetical protein
MSLLNEKIEQLRAFGNREEITAQLAGYVIAHPQSAQAWYTLSQFVEEKERKLDCLERALSLQPDMAEAKAALLQLTTVLEVALQDTGFSPENAPPEKPHTPAVLTGTEGASPEPAAALAGPAHPSQDVPQTAAKKKQAGESTALMALFFGKQENKYHKMAFAVIVILVIIAPSGFLLPKDKQLPGVLLLLALAFVIYRLGMWFLDMRNDARHKKRDYSKGARGEKTVGALLEALGNDYKVWHDVPITYGNIDHVVLCKNGQIFMIETKANKGRVTFAGDDLKINGYIPEKNMIRQCLNNLFELQAIVEQNTGRKTWVTAILVFTDAYVQIRMPIKGVTVTYAKNLQWVIRNKERGQKPAPELWANLDKLDMIFSRENRTYKEFASKDFARMR